jgi:hypothetical protein
MAIWLGSRFVTRCSQALYSCRCFLQTFRRMNEGTVRHAHLFDRLPSPSSQLTCLQFVYLSHEWIMRERERARFVVVAGHAIVWLQKVAGVVGLGFSPPCPYALSSPVTVLVLFLWIISLHKSQLVTYVVYYSFHTTPRRWITASLVLSCDEICISWKISCDVFSLVPKQSKNERRVCITVCDCQRKAFLKLLCLLEIEVVLAGRRSTYYSMWLSKKSNFWNFRAYLRLRLC